MMKKIMPCLLIMVFLCTASMPVFANEQEDDIIRIARKCIREQYPLPNEMIEDMVGFIDDYNEDLETWTVKFKIFDFSSVMFTVEVWEETASEKHRGRFFVLTESKTYFILYWVMDYGENSKSSRRQRDISRDATGDQPAKDFRRRRGSGPVP